jgi:hypothetical protein
MSKGNKVGLLTFCSLAFLGVTPIYATEISVVGGPTLTTTTVTAATAAAYQLLNGGQSAGVGYAAGVLVGFDLIPELEIESGLLYTHDKINASFNAPTLSLVGSQSASWNYLQVPVVVRCHVLPVLGLGAGVYYGHTVGGVTTTSTIAGIPNSTSSVSNSSLSSSDFGFIFNARGNLPIAEGISALIDIRYLLGVTNGNTDGSPNDNFSMRQTQFLAGLSFSLDSPSAPDKPDETKKSAAPPVK